MNLPARPGGSSRPILAVSVLGCLEFLAAGSAVIFAFQESETTPHIGLSGGRIALAVLALIIALSILGAGLFCSRSRLTFRDLYDRVPASFGPWLVAAGILAAAVGWISIFAPPYVFGERAGYFSRLRPLLVAAALLVVELWIAIRLSLRTGTFAAWLRGLHITDARTFSITFLCLLGVWLLMLISKLGIEKVGPFWNSPGMPLSGLQGLGVLILICLGVLFSRKAQQTATPRSRAWQLWLPALAIYICAVMVWGLTPMQRHYFSLRPAPPSFQPFPYSDARNYDVGALSVIMGQGIYFHDFTDKPLYIVYLALLHLLGGDNYVLITWLQVATLAWIPVILYLLGGRFHSKVLGAAVALMTIFQQANSIQASREVDSVNPRLLMTEVPTLLAMVALAYVLFRWFTTGTSVYALISGAAIGAASVIRVNPLMLLPVAGLFAVLVLRRRRRLIYRHVLLFSAGFVVIFSPWLVTGVTETGVPWLWVKFQYIIGQRFHTMVAPPQLGGVPEQTISWSPRNVAAGSTATVGFTSIRNAGSLVPPSAASGHTFQSPAARTIQSSGAESLVPRMLSHSLHNMAAALLSLPDLVTLDNLDQLGEKDPWGSATWTGRLTGAQHVAALVNLILLAIGLTWSWRRFRLAGLVPALVFLGYDLSLSVATTSGGRYIVPINWAAHFYYALGWVAVVNGLIHAPQRISPNSGNAWLPSTPSAGGSFILAAAAIVLVAILIPVANVVVPQVVQPHVTEGAHTRLAAISPGAGPGVRLAYGKVLYPYYHSDTKSVSFDFLNDAGYLSDLVVAKKYVFPYTAIQSGSFCLAGYVEDAEGRAVRFLYVAPPE